MRTITKGPEPRSLVEHRCSADANYANFGGKPALRQHLVREQRGLCCYCMSRIGADAKSMTIEHWHPRSRYPTEELDYRNLLASCIGHSQQGQTSNASKGDTPIARNPAEPGHRVDRDIRYLGDGMIHSDDPEWNRDLTEVLNLNAAFLVNNRKAALDAFVTTLGRTGSLHSETLKSMLRRANGDAFDGYLNPFCQVVVYWLQKRLSRAYDRAKRGRDFF